MDNSQKVKDLETKVNELIKKGEARDADIEKLKRDFLYREGFQLKFPMDEQSKTTLKDVITESIIDIVWNKYFYYFEPFNSTESLSVSIGGTSGVGYAALPQPVFYAYTGAISSDGVLASKNLFDQDILTFAKKQYIRTQIRMNSVTSVEAMVGVGDIRIDNPNNGFGFYIENSTLKGVVNRDSVEYTVTLQTIAIDTEYFVEAQLEPDGNRVIFFVDNIQKGVISQVPLLQGNSTLWQLHLVTNSAASKEMYLQTFELIQEK